MIELREYTHEQYINDLKKELTGNGLRQAIGKRLDEINDYCAHLGYVGHSGVQELLVEILDLLELEGKA